MNKQSNLEDYTEEVILKDGSPINLRPIRPDDAPRLQQTFSMLSPETIYMRFLSAAKGLSDKQARFLAEVDYHDRMAIVGTIQEAGEERIIGVARYGVLGDHSTGLAEVAVVVRDDYQKRGLGKLTMHRLAQYAQEQGLKAFVANVHTSNKPVLSFVQHSGLQFDKKMVEPGVWEIRILLAPV